MRAVTNVFLYNNDEKFFGEGPCRLLHGIETYGSLRAAAMQMNLSYSKALVILQRAEKALGFPLTEKTIGGKGGGGSRLTKEAKTFLEKYEAYRDACYEANQTIYQEVFEKRAKLGCVIMASGQSKRFGENKLLVDFHGKTIIERILDLTEGDLFAKRVVLTRTKEVEEICKCKGVEVIFHDLNGRGDAVRLGVEQMAEMDGCMFCPCDQPLLKRTSLEKMAETFSKRDKKMLRLGFGERYGAPVTFSKEYFEELKNLPEKSGGSYLIKKYPEEVEVIQADSELELQDMDTKEEYERLLGKRL